MKSNFNILDEYRFVNLLLILILVILLTVPFFIYIPNVSSGSDSFKISAPYCFVRKHTGHFCPTCGMTRSVVALYNNKRKLSISFNPNGYLLVIALVFQLFARLIPALIKKWWIPWIDMSQIITMSIFFKFIMLN